MIFSLRAELAPGYRLDDIDHARIRVHVFAGPDPDHQQLTGALVLTVAEWQIFGAVLMMGADRSGGRLDLRITKDPLGESVEAYDSYPYRAGR